MKVENLTMDALFNTPGVLSYVARILLACLCGGVIGLERAKRLKEAGIRTHCIIAATAALLMIVSKYGFEDLMSNGELLGGSRGADAARIAAGVVTGISFLGAGVIFKNGNSVRGLTTASGIWATAAVGIAIGAGMVIPGLMLLLIVMLVQILFHRFNVGSDLYAETEVVVTAQATEQFIDWMNGMAEQKRIQILSFNAARGENGNERYEVVFRPKKNIDIPKTLKFFQSMPEIINIHVHG